MHLLMSPKRHVKDCVPCHFYNTPCSGQKSTDKALLHQELGHECDGQSVHKPKITTTARTKDEDDKGGDQKADEAGSEVREQDGDG